VRSLFTAAMGEPATHTLLTATAALANTATRRPLGLLVDACQQYSLLQEEVSRRRAWGRWEAALAEHEGAFRAPPRPRLPRPAALPTGPVERVSEGSALAALGGAAALLALGGAPLASAAVTAGTPRAARGGRECFAAQLDRDAGRRGCLVLDQTAMRRLDRTDTVVLDADVMRTGRQVVGDVLPLGSEPDLSALVERVHDLVDPRRPRRRREWDGWSAEPLGDVPDELPDDLPADVRSRAGEIGARSSAVLGLWRGSRMVALVGVSEELDPFAEAVAAAAGRAGLVLIGGPTELDRRLGTDGTVRGGPALAESVRDLQRTGHVVALVAATHGDALVAADVGIGLVRPRAAPAWSADVLVRGAGEVCLLLDSVTAAHDVSRRSAQLAVAGSALGGLLALMGPPPGAVTRASVPVHIAGLLALGYGTWSAMALARRPPPPPAERTPWHAMSPRAVLESLETSREGLSESESLRRQRDVAAPAAGDEVGLGRASMEELANPMTPALAAGAGVSAGMGSLLDPLLITFVLVVNAFIGGVQRLGAQRALRTLRTSAAVPIRVRRDGAEVSRRSGELVAGDVISLQAGDAVPADCRLLSAHGLEVDESSLTGESALVMKSVRATSARDLADRHSMLFDGSLVAAGRAEAVVVATGDRSEAGRTAHLQEEAPPTGVEVRLHQLTVQILPISVGAGVALAVIDLVRARPMAQALGRAVSLAVAAVPEGLPFVATVAELAAARRLSARGALVRNPPIVEALGRVDVLCFDKTGTLTEGRIALRGVSDGVDTRPVDGPLPDRLREVLAAAVRASPFHLDGGQVSHQTDLAVLRGAERLGVRADLGVDGVEHLDDLPFESNRGYHATLWRGPDGSHVSVKGAPEVVLPLCSRWRRAGETILFDAAARAAVEAEVDRLARQGHRVLVVAERRVADAIDLAGADVSGLELRGLVALADPVRPTAASSVATLRAAGVQVIMITGDHPSTAEFIAAELDALNGHGVVTGAELDDVDDDQLADLLPRTAVFARVTPAQKARVVQVLQRTGAAVAVTGDGTNDAPAIRLADVGIALGARATPAAREAADLVITDDRIETITDAIIEGRGMWASVREALSILLGGNLGEISYTLATGVLGGGVVLNARQLLLINLLTDVLPAMAVAVRPPPDLTPEKLLAEGPEGSLGAALTRDIRLRAATTATSAAGAWFLARPVSTAAQASTTGLVALIGAQLAQTLAVRGRTPLVTAAAAGSFVLLAVVVQVPGISRVVGCVPLLPHQWLLAVSAAGVATVAQVTGQRILAR
jgi:cation-transporting ATPase I